MRQWPLLALTLSLSANTVAAAAEAAKDWPQWRGPNRDAVSLEKNLLKEWPEQGPPLVWDSSLVNPGKDGSLGIAWATVSIANGKVYTMGKENKGCHVFCLDEATGKLDWSTRICDARGGPNSTPTLDGDRTYALSFEGVLVCLGTQKGDIIWKKDMVKDFQSKWCRNASDWGFGESPLVDGDKVIVTPGADDATLIALNKLTGETIWKAFIKDGGGWGWSSAVVAEVGGIRHYVQSMGNKETGLVGVRASDGKFLWKYAGAAGSHAQITTPIIKGDLVFTANSYNGGSSLVQLVPDGDGGITPKEIYHLKANMLASHHGGVILVGDKIYGSHGQNNGMPFCLDMKTGSFDWKPVRGAGKGSAGVVYADGHLYYRYEDNVVALVEATPKGYNLKSRFQIGIGDPTFQHRDNATHRDLPGDLDTGWPHPVVVHGRLYIRAKNKVLCYDIRQSAVPQK